MNVLSNEGVDIRRRSIVRHARMNDYGFGLRLRREVTLVAFTYNFAGQAKSEEDLCGRREQRNDPHDKRNFSTILLKATCTEKICGGICPRTSKRGTRLRPFFPELRQSAIAGWCRSFRSAREVSRDRTASDRAFATWRRFPLPCAWSARRSDR